jgi:hypothetical protein
MPGSTVEGSADVTLTLRGTGFVPHSVVLFERVPLETTFISTTELKATLAARLSRTVGTYRIRIWNPRPGGGESANLPLIVRY